MKYSFKLVYPTQQHLIDAGFGRVAHVPCIFDSQPRYHRFGSRYLIDRALGIWDPKHRGCEEATILPAATSIENRGDWLVNFLEWCDVRGVDPMKAEYGRDIIGRYQAEMLEGFWSVTGEGLSERTINVRVGTASEYLLWAADKGLRDAFIIPTVACSFIVGNAASSVSHYPRQVMKRKGKLRESKRRLGFPAEKEIATWLHRMYQKKYGLTEGLICETVLETALRETEVSCLRMDTLPRNRAEWNIPNPEAPLDDQAVLVRVRYGTKGHDYGSDHGDKIGPVGDIRIPLPLANKLHHYREVVRHEALALALRKGRTAAEQRRIRDDAVHLFLNPRTGRRYTGGNIYDLWRSVNRPKGWCPHLARDFWACSVLWRRIQEQRELLERALKCDVDEWTLALLRTNAESIIELEIKQQLRHVSRETTLVYLQWLIDRLGINLNLHQRWAEEIGDDAYEAGLQ